MLYVFILLFLLNGVVKLLILLLLCVSGGCPNDAYFFPNVDSSWKVRVKFSFVILGVEIYYVALYLCAHANMYLHLYLHLCLENQTYHERYL